jgi:hypothetical protein
MRRRCGLRVTKAIQVAGTGEFLQDGPALREGHRRVADDRDLARQMRDGWREYGHQFLLPRP